VTDSTCDLPDELVEKLGISVVPLYIRVNSRSYREGIDLTWQELYEKISTGPELPTTSQPSPGDFFSVYEKIVENGDSIISIHISTKLSGTFNSALAARGMILDEYENARIDVLDSLSASWGLGIMAITAAEMAQQGASQEEIVDTLKNAISTARGLIMANSLDHLFKGGRISRSQAFLGNLMNIVPVIYLHDGLLTSVDRAMGSKAAVRKIGELMREKTTETPPSFISLITGTRENELDSFIDDTGGLFAHDSTVWIIGQEQDIMGRDLHQEGHNILDTGVHGLSSLNDEGACTAKDVDKPVAGHDCSKRGGKLSE
jgi:DegV family protein with EDD domain